MLNERKDISGRLAVWVVICFTVIAMFCATFFNSFDNGTYYAQLLIYLIGIVGAIIISKSAGVDYFQNSLIKNKINFQSAVYVMVMGLGLLYFGSFFANAIYYGLELVGYTPIASDISVTNISELVLNLIFVGILPALSEEFLIRGGVFSSMNKTQKCTRAIILSAFFFAILHGSVVQTAHQFIVGIVCAMLLLVGKSLWYPIILHAFNNCFAVVMTYVTNISGMGEESLTAVEFFAFDTLIIQALLAVAGFFVAYFAFRAFLRKEERKMGEEYADSVVQNPLFGRVVYFDKDEKIECKLFERIAFWCATGVCLLLIVLDFVGGLYL